MSRLCIDLLEQHVQLAQMRRAFEVHPVAKRRLHTRTIAKTEGHVLRKQTRLQRVNLRVELLWTIEGG